MRKENLSPEAIDDLLNKRCGLLGISKLSEDTRELTKHMDDERVVLALNMFAYRVRKYIGAYLAVLERADAIVVGGGIGENTPIVRELIFRNLAQFGALLDTSLNASLTDREGAITTADSALPIWVIPTQEGLMIARELRDC
jgi:acetate kinase